MIREAVNVPQEFYAATLANWYAAVNDPTYSCCVFAYDDALVIQADISAATEEDLKRRLKSVWQSARSLDGRIWVAIIRGNYELPKMNFTNVCEHLNDYFGSIGWKDQRMSDYHKLEHVVCELASPYLKERANRGDKQD